MKKASIFSKKFVSWLLSVSIIAGTLACLSTTTLFAEDITPEENLKPGVLRKDTYDFTSEFNYTSYKSGSSGSIVADPADVNNKCFAITGGSYQSYALCLPYTIDNNSKYRISYDIKAESGTTIVNNYETTGIRVTYAADGKNVQNNQEMNANGLTSASLHKYLWGTKNEAAAYPTEWTKQSIEISTGESEIIGNRNTLAFFVRFNKADGKIYLDNIVVEKLDPNVGFYDFEDYVNVKWKFSGSNPNDLVSLVNDTVGENENHYLKMTKCGNWNPGYVVFPFELQNGATYKVSYEYKVDSVFNGRVALTASAATNGVLGDATNGRGTTPSVVQRYNSNNKLADFYYYDTKWADFKDTTWTKVTNTITVGDSDITNTIKYLAMYYSSSSGSSIYDTMYIDNLVIEKLSTINFVPYFNGKESSDINLDPVTDTPGTTVSSDRLNVPGYNIVGIYTDDQFNNKFTGNEFTIGSTDTTYYVKYELPKSATYDFQNGNEYLDFGIQLNKTQGEVSVFPETETGNRCLKLYNTGWNGMLVNLPYVLENNTEYFISYKLRADSGVQVRQDGDENSNYSAGIYVGKSTGVTESGAGIVDNDQAKRVEITNYIQGRLSTLYGTGTTMNEGVPTTWTRQTRIIKTSENAVNNDYKYLCFNFVPTNVDGVNYATLYLDDIYIQKVSTESAEYNFENGMKDISFVKGDDPSKVEDPVVATIPGPGVDAGNTKALKVQTYGWKWTKLIFPFELKAGTTYKISYNYRSETNDVSLASVSGILAATSAGGTVYANRFGFFRQESGDFNWDLNKISDTKWYSRKFTFTANDTQVTNDYKYLAIMLDDTTGTNGYIYLDNLVIEKVVKLSFGADADEIIGDLGGKFTLPTPKAKFGYTFGGWYDSEGEAANLIGNAGEEIPCPAKDTTYYAKWVKNESYEINFNDGNLGSILSTGEKTPAVEQDPTDSNNWVLKTNGVATNEAKYNFVLPVGLKAGTDYTVSFRYKATFPENAKEIILDYTQGNAESLNYAGSYISVADSEGVRQGKPLTLLLGDKDPDELGVFNEPNKLYSDKNTEWKTRTFRFKASEAAADKYVMLNLVIYYNQTTDSCIYFDDISIQETPTATFMSNDEQFNSIMDAPGTTIKPGCPTRAGYTFKGWYVNDEKAGFDELTMPKEDTTYIAEWEKVLKVGNVNADANDDINDADFIELKKILLGIETKYNLNLADCSGDATVDILDLVRLKKYLANGTALGKTVYGTAGYQLVWNEEFDGNKLNTNTFTSSQTQGDVEGVKYTDDQIDVSKGSVKLNATKNAEDGIVYYANAIVTDNTMNFKHGYVEVRAKLPYMGQGEWPAIWGVSSSAYLAGTQNERAMEIDLAENMGGGTLHAQIHNWLTDGVTDSNDHRNLIPTEENTNKDNKEYLSQVHTYGMLWTETSVTFYLDDTQYASYTFKEKDDIHVTKKLADQLISLRIENKFNDQSCKLLSKLSDNAIEVEYVRLYQIPSESILISKK